MAAGIPGLQNALQYQLANLGLNPFQTAVSDFPGGGTSGGDLSGLFGGGGASSLFGGAGEGLSFLPPPFDLTAIIPALGSLGLNLASMFSGRSSTGPGSATSDIASGGSSSSDPVIRLLGEGAGALPPGVPISSSSGAASGFGPYFDVARKLEDLVRWGPGGLTDPRAEGLDATTLKKAMTELGNPGTDAGTGTLQALQNAFNTGSKYLTTDNINKLIAQLSPQEQNIFKTVWNPQGGTIPTGNIPNNPNNPNNPFNPNPNFNPMQNPLFSNTNPASLMQLLGLGGGAPPMNISGDWLGGRIGPPAMLGSL